MAFRNRFSELSRLCEEQEPEKLANNIKYIFKEEEKHRLQKKNKKHQPFISDVTLKMIEERKTSRKTPI